MFAVRPVSRFADALDLGSGISRQNNFGGVWDSYAVRGFAGDPNYGSDFLVNGFSSGRGYNGLRDSANISSIEILKGPAAALYGRGEPGGIVNIATRKPLFQPSYSIEQSIGSHQTWPPRKPARAIAGRGPRRTDFAGTAPAAFSHAQCPCRRRAGVTVLIAPADGS